MNKKIILVLTAVMILATAALATGINIYITDGAIKNKDGGALSDSDYHAYQSKLEFFHNSLPAPNATGRLTVSTGSQYTKIGAQNKYQLSSLDGGTLYVRVWNGTVAPTAPGNNYYGKASYPVASGTTLPYDSYINDLRTVYKADVPFVPTIGSISEAMIRTGDTLVLTLTVPVVYNELGAGNERREITDRSLVIIYPNGDTETRSGNSITLSGDRVQTGAYVFKPSATNWYGSTSGDDVSYVTLGLGGISGPETVTYTFVKPEGALGINPFGFPFANVVSPEGVNNVKNLVEAINTQVGENVVTVVGWWDKERQQPAGYIVTYGSTTINDIRSYIAVGRVSEDPAGVTLDKDRAYQVSVLKGATVKFKGTR